MESLVKLLCYKRNKPLQEVLLYENNQLRVGGSNSISRWVASHHPVMELFLIISDHRNVIPILHTVTDGLLCSKAHVKVLECCVFRCCAL